MIYMKTSDKHLISKDFLKLNSCDIQKLWDKDYFTLRENGRPDYHILYIISGKCTAVSEGKEITILPGEIFLIPPGEKHVYSFKAEDKPISCYIHFSGTGCEKLLSKAGFFPDRVLHLKKSRSLEEIFEKLCREFHMKKPLFNEFCSSYLIEFFSLAGRKNEELKNPVLSKNKREIDNILNIMIEEYEKNHPVSYYAKICHLSVSRFQHIFKSCTGRTPVEYINAIRINHAKEHLINTDLSVSAISEAVGFSDQNYFSRIFKKHTGISPNQFRK